jgi:hypothetical protein
MAQLPTVKGAKDLDRPPVAPTRSSNSRVTSSDVSGPHFEDCVGDPALVGGDIDPDRGEVVASG